MTNKTRSFFILVSVICILIIGFIFQYKSKLVSTRLQELEFISSVAEFLKKENVGDYILSINRDSGKNEVIISDISLTKQYLLNINCDRLYASDKYVLCAGGYIDDNQAITLFDTHGVEKFSLPIEGITSRVRVSKDSRYGAVTTFVSGDSYAVPEMLSTRTYIFDLENGIQLATMEEFSLIKDGIMIAPIDRNYWGVTFFENSNEFLATVMYGTVPYLVKGNIENKTIEVIAEEVECPSLSPDNTKIVYKKRQPGATWRLYEMVLDTKEVHSLSETENIDDQVEWLDSSTVLYERLEDEETHIMKVVVDSPNSPKLFLKQSSSPSVMLTY